MLTRILSRTSKGSTLQTPYLIPLTQFRVEGLGRGQFALGSPNRFDVGNGILRIGNPKP